MTHTKTHIRFLVALVLAGDGAGQRLAMQAGTSLSNLHKASRGRRSKFHPWINTFIAQQFEKHRDLLSAGLPARLSEGEQTSPPGNPLPPGKAVTPRGGEE